MINVWKWLNDNAAALGLIIVAMPLVWSIGRFFRLKRQELRAERFKTYHDLIKQLVEQESETKPKMLDRQLAVVFELRRFPEYFEPSLRIIKGLRESWSKTNEVMDNRNRLMEEMDATVSHIEKNSRNWIHRILQKARGL